MAGCITKFGPVATAGFAVVHGLYTVLFLWALLILARRLQPAARSTWLFLSTTLLFVGVTAFLVLQLANPSSCVEDSRGLGIPSVIIILLVVFTADGVLIDRCFVIWGRKRVVVVGPIVMLLTSIGLGAGGALLLRRASAAQHPTPDVKRMFTLANVLFGVFLVMLVLTCLLVTILTATRIWWLSRRVGRRDTRERYRTIASLILESGMLYCVAEVTLFVVLALGIYSPLGTFHKPIVIFGTLAVESAGISPTLLIVRAECSQSSDLPHSETIAVPTSGPTVMLDSVWEE